MAQIFTPRGRRTLPFLCITYVMEVSLCPLKVEKQLKYSKNDVFIGRISEELILCCLIYQNILLFKSQGQQHAYTYILKSCAPSRVFFR